MQAAISHLSVSLFHLFQRYCSLIKSRLNNNRYAIHIVIKLSFRPKYHWSCSSVLHAFFSSHWPIKGYGGFSLIIPTVSQQGLVPSQGSTLTVFGHES
jgi:hypothetical protein